MIGVRARHDGAEVAAFPLEHGADPAEELAVRGWRALSVTASGRVPELTLTYAVEPAPAATPPAPPLAVGVPTPGDGDPGRGTGVRRQRLAAYAVVLAGDRLLLTELSDHVVGVGGAWLLPGGGIDPGEEPGAAIVREIWEETGQHVDEVELLTVLTTHRVLAPGSVGPRPGSAAVPSGWATDFHAVRLLHRARCLQPTEAVVHDVGGSTARAAWVPVDEVAAMDLVPWVRELLTDHPALLHP